MDANESGDKKGKKQKKVTSPVKEPAKTEASPSKPVSNKGIVILLIQ